MGIDDEPEKKNINPKEYAFRIYKIYNFSPLKRLEIKELSDFIIPPNELETKHITFKEYIKENTNKKIKLKIFSLLYRKVKEIEIEINDTINNREGVLGCEMNYENFIQAQEKLLHVIKVKENSFAKNYLNLEELNDYIITLKPEDSDFQPLNGSYENPIDAFSNIIKNNIGKKCDFYIYNKNMGARVINVNIPNDEMFEMGCDVAFGKLHEFPLDNSVISKDNYNDNYNDNKDLNRELFI
jgi:hypothetical protein